LEESSTTVFRLVRELLKYTEWYSNSNSQWFDQKISDAKSKCWGAQHF
jgi:hypothetical protein